MENQTQSPACKIGIVALKVIPVIIACLSLTAQIMLYFGNENILILNSLSCCPLLALLFMWIVSLVLGFRLWHRLVICYLFAGFVINECARYGVIVSMKLFDTLDFSALVLLLVSEIVYAIIYLHHQNKGAVC